MFCGLTCGQPVSKRAISALLFLGDEATDTGRAVGNCAVIIMDIKFTPCT